MGKLSVYDLIVIKNLKKNFKQANEQILHEFPSKR